LMAEVARATGEAFAATDPEHATDHRRNAQQVAGELETLAADIGALLGGECTFDEVIVSHEAYAYLLAPHGKTQHGVAGAAPEAGASAAQLAELVAEIREAGIGHVLAEPVEGRGDAEALAREAGAELREVNPLEGVDAAQRELGYPELLRQQAQTFATALCCEGRPTP
jgi:zinc transport system substrate-binding protein